VSPAPPEPGATADSGLADGLRDRAERLLAACSAAPPDRLIAIADHGLTVSLLAAAGAIEIAVHTWDLCVTCGGCQPIPAELASGLLQVAPLLVTAGTRDGLFAEPVPVPPLASPWHRLVAFLGRNPGWPVPGQAP
jgi:hypothetical protein